jgi:hypothetical protein
MSFRAVFFDEDDARAAAARLVADGFTGETVRERLAGEDDEEDHPWAVLTDAPEVVVELLVERYDGWLDVSEPEAQPGGPPGRLPPPPPLPQAPLTSRGRRTEERPGRT